MSSSASRSICNRCSASLQWHRKLSTTTPRLAVLPESPRFINVPEALQTPKPPKPPIKGILPIPRNIFKPSKLKKYAPEHLSLTTPPPGGNPDPPPEQLENDSAQDDTPPQGGHSEPPLVQLEKDSAQDDTPPPGGHPEPPLEELENESAQDDTPVQPKGKLAKPAPIGPDADRLLWKERMAESRRRNLHQGINELLKRKETRDQVLETRGANRRERHERLANRPEREDEQLTNNSLHHSVRRILAGDVPQKRVATWRALEGDKFVRREAKKSSERRNQLHILYTHARRFILTEDAMNEALDKAFGTDDHPVYWNSNGNSIWSLGKDPAGTQDMLNMEQYVRTSLNSNLNVKETVVQKRMRRIAEEFTGGRLASSV